MIGSSLLRYSLDPLCVGDAETFGNSLNLHEALPWEWAWATMTIKGGVQQAKSRLIRWPNVWFSPDNPSAARFDRARYEREAIDPREAWEEFSPLLKTHRFAGHGILGFDLYVLANWQRAIGITPNWDWLYEHGILDTNCVSKAYRAQWVPDISSPEAFLGWQYRAQSTRLAKGVKTKLGVMCGEFGIEYDERQAHGAVYDVERNVMLVQQLAWKVEI